MPTLTSASAKGSDVYSIKYFWVPGKLNIVIMEMIMIEKRVYDSMVAKLEALAGRIEALNEKQQKRLGHWLDNEEVCEMLSIAKRTLQVYREKRIIPYTQVGHKIYYKPQDVEALLKQSKK